MARVYLDTSFVSACVTTRNEAFHITRRQTSQEWWASQRSLHEVFVSAEVIKELDSPRFRDRDAALRLLDGVATLPIVDEALSVASVFVAQRVMPGPIGGDGVHVAVCCVEQVDWLLSWNVRHLANPRKSLHLQNVCRRLGIVPPSIVTPDVLWEPDP